MSYSQKYALVQFFQQTDDGEVFHMSDWPLHITLADVFAVDVNDRLLGDLQAHLNTKPFASTHVSGETTLGTTDVWLLQDTPELHRIHTDLIDILEKHGAIFNEPAFTRDGFLPHITKQPGSDMQVGDKIMIETFSLVDMFPDQDWQQRKVSKHFRPDSI